MYQLLNKFARFIIFYSEIFVIVLISFLTFLESCIPNFVIFTACLLFLLTKEFFLKKYFFELKNYHFIIIFFKILEGIIIFLILLVTILKVPILNDYCNDYSFCKEFLIMPAIDKVIMLMFL